MCDDSRDGHPGIKANLKAVQGDLFMLEKYIFFVSKQPTLVELSDIHQCVFSRVGASMGASAARTFDLKIVTKSGPEYTFTSINKEEHEPVETFLKDKKVKIKNEMVPDVDMMMAVNGGDSDEEMQSVASSGDERPKPRVGGDEDDSEEGWSNDRPSDPLLMPFVLDEDFQASSSDQGSPSESDSDSEGGVTASDASGDRELTKAAKDGKKKLTKKKAKAQAKGSDAEDAPKKKPAKPKAKSKPKKDDENDAMDVDEDDKPKPRPKPKPKVKEGDDDGPAKKKQKTSP